jgi:SAM-dependent methyltransferase
VDIEALLTTSGQAALSAAMALGEADPLVAASRLRADGHDPALAAAALTQARLRERAAAKFGERAASMYFTPDGLEQATRPAVAARRAHRFAAAGATRIADLCCGIGSDLTAFTAAGLAATGVDLSPGTVAAARLNAPDAEVVCGDVTTFALDGFDAAFCDPARRAGGRRVFDPSAYSPPWPFLLSLAGRIPRTGVKVAPGIGHELVPSGAEAEWVSVGGDVVEAALWFGPLASADRRATLLPSGATLTGSGERQAGTGPLRRWIYDPDGAVVRSHLVAELAELLGANLVDPSIAYLTSDDPVDTPFARRYEVTGVLGFSVKRLRALLAARGVGRLTIKKRGSAVTPEQLRPQLKLRGDREATVFLTRIAGAPSMILSDPPG